MALLIGAKHMVVKAVLCLVVTKITLLTKIRQIDQFGGLAVAYH